jgi:glycosyltransferase involved in cell wall biosynthesis
MRALMLGWEWPPHVAGGLGVACSALARGLAALGVDVTFLLPALEGDEEPGGVRLLGVGQAAPAARRAPAYGAATATATATAAPSVAGRYGADLLGQVARFRDGASRAAGRGPYDVVHGHDWTSFPAARACADPRGLPLVLHVHSIEADRSGPAEHPRVADVEAAALAGADAVVCVSRASARRVASRYDVSPERLHVVHNAVDPPPAGDARGRTGAGPLVLFAARVTRQKSPGAFLEAARLVLERAPGTRFLVAGGGDLWASSVERAAELGIARSVRFTGALPRERMADVFARADVFVMPSASEPFGLAAAEAAARGVPVVVASGAGVLERLPSALRADFRRPEDLAAKVLGALSRAALRDALRRGGRAEAARLDWRLQAARTATIYERLVG